MVITCTRFDFVSYRNSYIPCLTYHFVEYICTVKLKTELVCPCGSLLLKLQGFFQFWEGTLDPFSLGKLAL